MKFLFFTVLIIVLTGSAYSQYSLRAGMGIDFASMPSLIDYQNQNFAPGNKQLGIFNSAVNFSVEGDYFISGKFDAGIEAAYTINSFSYNSEIGIYDLSYGIIMPSIMSYYVIKGEGYNFKFGGGIGPRFVSVNETRSPSGNAINYSSTGFGFILRTEGNTMISKNLYASIGADIRYDLNGEPKNSGGYLINIVSGKNVNFNSFSAGIKLGLTYLF